MKGRKERLFRRRTLVLLLCMAMLAQPLTAFGAEQPSAAGQDQILPDIDAQNITEGGLTEEPDAAGEESVYGDPEDIAPGSQDAENYFSPEEIQAAEDFYKIEAEEEPEPTEAEIEAERQEKERLHEKALEGLVDGSEKLLGWGDEEGDPADDLEETGWPFSKTHKYTMWVGNTKYNDTMPNLVKKSLDGYGDLWLADNTWLFDPIVIPDGKTINLHTNGYILGNNVDLKEKPLIRVGKKATLRLSGMGDGGRGVLKGGKDGAIVAGNGSTLILKDLLICYNETLNSGGAIYLGSETDCRLTNVHIENNKAESTGGGIYASGDSANIRMDQKTWIMYNSAKSGGGIFLNGNKINIYGPAEGRTVVRGNTVTGVGGGMYVAGSDCAIAGVNFEENKSNDWAGGVMFNKTGGSLANCDIFKNESLTDGGGVYINGKVATLTDVRVYDNICGWDREGGGIYVDSMDNIGSGGLFYVYNNYNKNSARRSDLYLQDGRTTSAYLHVANYAPGSKIGIGVTDWKEGQRISFSPGSFNPRLFEVNNDIYSKSKNKKAKDKTFYVAFDQNTKSKTYRHLVLTTNKSTALVSETQGLDGRNAQKARSDASAGLNYTAENGGVYPVYSGFTSSPSHTDETKDIVNKYFYSDGYFMDDPKTYNPHLSTFGMNLAMASADSNIGGHSDYSFKFDNVKSMMMGMGCKEEDIWISPSYIVKPTDSSIGVAIGKKTIKDAQTGTEYTLVPIAIRSYGYEKEWASNMTLNGNNTKDEKNAESSGFRDARTKTMEAIKGYIGSYGLDAQLSQGRVKFFLVGFSRGSATANLTSKALVDTYGTLSEKYKDNPNQVYGYCYAVPAGGTDSCDLSLTKNRSAYYCIHNIINKVDLTPMVAPKEMGFKRYGVDHFVPGDNAAEVKSDVEYAKKDNGSYKLTKFYDNNAWYTDSSAYKTKRPDMLKQLAMVNDEIFFVDWFKETDLDISMSGAIASKIKGIFTETSVAGMNEVKNSTKTIETWLPEFYATIQKYDTLDLGVNLTRDRYSNYLVRGGADNPGKRKNWRAGGVTAQDTFRGLVMMMLSKTPSEKADLGAAFAGVKNKLSTKNMAGIYNLLLNSSKGWDYSHERQQDYLDMFWNALKDNKYGQKAIQDAIKDPAELKDLENYFPALMGIVMRIARQDFKDKSHSGHMRLAGTFAANTEAILQGHVPEIALAWLRAYDSYYTGETKSYRWNTETVTPGKVSYSLGGKTVSSKTTTNLKGDQIVKLGSTNHTDAIYYTIRSSMDDAGKKPLAMLYNNTKGIVLNAPKGNETITYTINAWTKNSCAGSSGKVSWLKGSESREYQFGVEKEAPKPEEENIIIRNVRILDQNGRYHSELNRINISTNTVFDQGEVKEYTVDLADYLPNNDRVKAITGENLFDHYFVDSVAGSYGSAEEKSGVTAYIYKPYVENGKPNPDARFLSIYIKPKISAIQLQGKIYKDLIPDPAKGRFYIGKLRAVDYNYRYGPKHYENGLNWPMVSWMVEEGGDYVPIGSSDKPEYGKKYKAVINFTHRPGNEKAFTDSVELVAPKDKAETSRNITINGGTAKLELEFKTDKIVIKECRAGVTAEQEPAAWIWKDTEAATARESAAKALPKYVGYIETETGEKLQGLMVDWDTSYITQEKLSNVGTIDVYGTIRHDSGSAKKFADYNWDIWKGASGLAEFQVKAKVYVVNTTELSPPSPDMASGNYVFDGYEEFPMSDDGGKMLVTLEDPNIGMEGVTVQYKKWTTEDPASVPFTDYDGQPIELNKPGEEETVSYNILVKAKASAPGYADSAEIKHTYTLTAIARRDVWTFTYDINKEELTSLEDVEPKLYETVDKGEWVNVDYEEIAEEDTDYTEKALVSWNAITKKEDGSLSIDRVPGDEPILSYPVSGNDLYLEAVTAPILDYVQIELEKPQTGESLPDMPEAIRVGIGGEDYDLEPASVSINWSTEDGSDDEGVVKAGTAYTAQITISADRIMNEDQELLGMKYFAHEDDLDVDGNGVNIDEVSGNTAGIKGLEFEVETDDHDLAQCVRVHIAYDETGSATFLSAEAPEGLNLPFNATTWKDRLASDIRPNLPGRTAVAVDDGSVQSLSVNWVEDGTATITDEEGNERTIEGVVAYEAFAYSDAGEDDDTILGYPLSANDLNGLDDLNIFMQGYVDIPEDMDIEMDEKGEPLNENIVSENGAWHCYFDYPVFLGGAPETERCEILPESGEYEPTTEDLVIDFEPSPQSSSENSVTVYYRITYGNDEEDEEDVYDYDGPLAWYDENWEIQKDEDVEEYVPGQAYASMEEEMASIAKRRITREIVEEKKADYARVTAVAVENGAYRVSEEEEAVYYFLDKPTAEIPEETLEKLLGLSLESGKTLKDITLPENCSWAEGTDLYKVYEGIEGERFDATVIYNNDPVSYYDKVVPVKVLILDGYYDITPKDCTAYLYDEEKPYYPEDWEVVKKAKPGYVIYVSANGVPEGLDPENASIAAWILTDENGNELEYDLPSDGSVSGDEYFEEDERAIFFEMPYSAVRVKPIWYDSTMPYAAVESLTLDRTLIELKKGETATLKAAAVYASDDEDAYKPPITFESSDPGVVEITQAANGTAVLKAVTSGKATIWVDCNDKDATCTVTVGQTYVDLQLTDCKAYDVTGGDETLLGETAVKGSIIKLVADAPKNPALAFTEWSIEGADIDRKKSEVTFTLATDLVAKAEYGISPDYEDPGEYTYGNVKVKNLVITDPATNKKASKVTVSLNGSLTVNAKAVYKNDADRVPILFRSGNTDVARVKTVSGQEPGTAQCVIVGLKPGTAVVTAYCGSRTVKLTVTVGDEEVKGIVIAGNRLAPNVTDDGQYQLELNTGEQELLEVLPDPMDNVTEMKFTWKSDDPKVATVRNGLITAKIADKGHTTVTVLAKTRPLGSRKWVDLKPVKVVVRVKAIEVPKKMNPDKSSRLTLKGSQNLDLNALRLGKKNVVSACEVQAKLKGSAPASLVWESTNENIVTVTGNAADPMKAEVKAVGMGTAYVVLKGLNADKAVTNQAVMKVTVKATAPELQFTNDSLGLLEFKEGKPSLTLKQGSYDRLYYSIYSELAANPYYAATEKITWSGSGGVTVKNGVVYAKKVPKNGKTAKVTLKCGKSKIELPVTVK